MIISTETHPNIMEAVHLIQQDTGDHLCIPVLDVPKRWESFLDGIEKTIEGLSRTERAKEEEPLPLHIKPNALLDSEFYSFCNGEYTAQDAMMNRDRAHMIAGVFLNDYFDGWMNTDEGHERHPENVVRMKRIEHLEMVELESGLGLTIEQQQELDQLRMALT